MPAARGLSRTRGYGHCAPGNLCNNLLHKFWIGVCLSEGAHVLQVARRESGDLREGAVEVFGQSLHDFGALPGPVLVVEDCAANVPVQEDELAVDCEDRAELGGANPLLQVAQEIVVAVGELLQAGLWFVHGRESRLLFAGLNVIVGH
jgi:hypothetical protein